MENKLLATLPQPEFERLRPHLQNVTLTHRQTVVFPGQPIEFVYFPLNCLLSLVHRMRDGDSVESETIGREGMSGLPVVLTASVTPIETVTQVAGDALRMSVDVVRNEYKRGKAFSDLLNRYIHLIIVSASQSAACNALHNVEARFCRWLLVSSDGTGSNKVTITQEYLAIMLGVRRATVTVVARKIQEGRLIEYRRGVITIIDRRGLEAVACECYATIRNEYNRLFA